MKIFHLGIFTKGWWKYIFAARSEDQTLFKTMICRWRGHPCGPIFYNPNGYEPNMYCKNCGDDLG